MKTYVICRWSETSSRTSKHFWLVRILIFFKSQRKYSKLKHLSLYSGCTTASGSAWRSSLISKACSWPASTKFRRMTEQPNEAHLTISALIRYLNLKLYRFEAVGTRVCMDIYRKKTDDPPLTYRITTSNLPTELSQIIYGYPHFIEWPLWIYQMNVRYLDIRGGEEVQPPPSTGAFPVSYYLRLLA